MKDETMSSDGRSRTATGRFGWTRAGATKEQREPVRRGGTLLVDTRQMNNLLESDRILRRELSDEWFDRDLSDVAIKRFDSERRVARAQLVAMALGLVVVLSLVAVLV